MGALLIRYARAYHWGSSNALVFCQWRSRCHQFCSQSQVIFSGIQPTGASHLGNYLGAFSQWVRLQDEALPSTQLFFSIADLHALTSNHYPERLRIRKRQMLATLIAVGLNPDRSTLFYQSSVPFKPIAASWGSKLADLEQGTSSHGAHVDTELQCLYGVPIPHDSMEGIRLQARTFLWGSNVIDDLKTKLGLGEDSIFDSGSNKSLKLGLFSYPVLQAADILLYG